MSTNHSSRTSQNRVCCELAAIIFLSQSYANDFTMLNDLLTRAVCLIATAVGMTAAATTQPQEIETETAVAKPMWIIDNDHSSVVFAVSHYGLSYIYGRFNRCEGSIHLDSNIPEQSTFSFEIDPSSVDTNNLKRDEHLKSKDFFDIEQYDSISFESTSVTVVDSDVPGSKTKRRTYRASGNLTMHGETRNIELPLELISVGKGHDGKDRCGFMSKFIIQRSDHGMDFMSDVVGDKIAITFCFQTVLTDKPAKEENAAPAKSETEPATEAETEPEEKTETSLNTKLLPNTYDSKLLPTNSRIEKLFKRPGRVLEKSADRAPALQR